MFGLDHKYGLPKIKSPNDPQIPLIMLRAILVPKLKKYYSNFTVYHIEDDLESVKSRLIERLQKGEEMGTRLADYSKEVFLGHGMADRVFNNNGNLNETVEAVKLAIVTDFNLNRGNL